MHHYSILLILFAVLLSLSVVICEQEPRENFAKFTYEEQNKQKPFVERLEAVKEMLKKVGESLGQRLSDARKPVAATTEKNKEHNAVKLLESANRSFGQKLSNAQKSVAATTEKNKGHNAMKTLLKTIGRPFGQKRLNAKKSDAEISTGNAHISMVTGDDVNDKTEKDPSGIISLWAKYQLFREAIAMQKMIGSNYCKGKQHYDKHFHVNLQPLDDAIEEMEKYGGNNLTNVKNKLSFKNQVLFLEEKVKAYYLNPQEIVGPDKEVEFSVSYLQVEFDDSVKRIAAAIAQEENPFERHRKAGELLELAAELWEKIVEYEKKAEKEQAVVIIAYNVFARKLELFINNGTFSRDLYGKFDMASFDQMMAAKLKKKNDRKEEDMEVNLGSVLNGFLMLVRELLTAYYKLQFPQMDVPKIRGSGSSNSHVVLSIGPVEYDLNEGGPRRRKFRYDLDEYTSECSLRKAKPIANRGLVKLSEADSLYNKMVKHNGWSKFNEATGRVCYAFVWNFLCDLFNGKCPREEDLPLNFVQLNRSFHVGSVFKTNKLNLRFIIR